MSLDSFLIISFPRVFRASAVWDKYSAIGERGRGTYGCVYEARDELSGERVAIKEIKLLNKGESVPLLAVREISALQALACHPCIVRLQEASLGEDRAYLVLELLDCTLHQLLHGLDGRSVSGVVFQHLAYQLVAAVAFMHSRRILSRDLKPANILIDLSRGRLKISDWGLSRFQLDTVANGLLTLEVASLWYRPIEVLLGSTSYGEGIDLWALGCLLAELLVGFPLFSARDEAETCRKIFKLLGKPSVLQAAHWSDFDELPAEVINAAPANVVTSVDDEAATTPDGACGKAEALARLCALEPSVDEEVFETVLSLLNYDEQKRVRAKVLLTEAAWLQDVDGPWVLSPAFRCPDWDSVLTRVRETRRLAAGDADSSETSRLSEEF
jgi:cyclin-dependent kinase 2